MASPFTFFRKYSAGMMIVLVILSMLIFTLDSLFSDSAMNLWLLGLLIGGAVFGIAGIGQGRWLQWGLGGAALGAIMGFILPGFVEGNGLSTALGVIDEEHMLDLEMRRSIANQFLFQATEASFGEGTGRFAPLFGFGHGSNREDVVFGKLMRAEADRLGIAVDKTMVNDYLKRATTEKLSAEDFVKIRNNLSYQNRLITDSQLFEILGDEIKARMAYQMLRPRTTALPPGPEVYWDYFRRLNVRQQLNTVALDVDEFLEQIPEPSDVEVNQLFAEYKEKFPGQENPGDPGFRLPFRAKLAWLELNSADVEKEIAEVTDADVEKYYNDNKETPLIRTPIIPDSKPADDPKSDEKPAADTKPTEEASDEKKASASEEAKKEEPTAAEPKPAEAKPAEPEKAAEEKPADEKPSESKSEDSAAKPEESATDEAKSDDDSSCGPVFDESTEKAAEEKAADEKPADEKPAAESNASESKADEATTKDDDAAAKTKSDEEKKPAAAPSLTIPSVPAAPTIPGTEFPETDSEKKPEIQYSYRVLDDELKKEIREEIVRQRTRELIETRITAAATQMETLARERSKKRFSLIEENPEKYEGRGEQQQKALQQLSEDMAPFDQEIDGRLKEYAQKNGLAAAETPLVTYAELLDAEDYPIGSATEPNENPMLAAQSANVAMTVFQAFSNDEQNNDAQLYLVRRAQKINIGLENSESHYVYWATDFSAAHVPTLDEAGVRDMVVKEWKRIKARELVKKRGEELVSMIQENLKKEGEEKKDLPTLLKEQTVTGKDGGAALAVRKTLPFSWLRTSSASPMSFQTPPATLSSITFEDAKGGVLEMAGPEFMEAVFDNMKDEEVSVVPNADRSMYYVVHVTNRFPTPEVGMDGLRDRFLTEGKQFGFSQSPFVGAIQQQLEGPASIEWEKSVWRRYGVDPDSEPDSNN